MRHLESTPVGKAKREGLETIAQFFSDLVHQTVFKFGQNLFKAGPIR